MKNNFYLDSTEEEDENFDEEDHFEMEYDEDSMLDMMYPERHEDDFDEDDMSWDNTFGND